MCLKSKLRRQHPMTRDGKLPLGTRTIRTYHDFEGYLRDFANDHYPFLWVYGRPGIGKTESLRAALGGRVGLTVKGDRVTGARLYRLCYEHRGDPIILDDVEHLLEDHASRHLVLALAETTQLKRLSWFTCTAPRADIPESFDT